MLRNIFSRSKRRRAPADLHMLAGNRTVEAVGESHYQKEFEKICGRKRQDGHNLPVVAELVPEPRNPHDANAVGVLVHGIKIAYLSRQSAARLQQPIAELSAAAARPVGCNAEIVGGWDRGGGDEGHFGIKLFFDEAELLPRKASKPPSPPAAPRGDAGRASRLWPVGAMPDGVVHDRHYTDWVATVKHLKREGELDEAVQLLRQCADATEDESASSGHGVALWYFEQLAICFRKQKDFEAEVAVLERFCALPHAPGASPPKLIERLAKARELQQRS